MRSTISFALAFASLLFPTGITASPTPELGLEARAEGYLPPKKLSDGKPNPFYPCPASDHDVSKCPFRCYTSDFTLLEKCLDGEAAQKNIAAGGHCVQCRSLTAYPAQYPGCQSLKGYYNLQKFKKPSAYGQYGGPTFNACKWTCGEAQVPFNVCSKTNDTGMYEACAPTAPFCSSPRPVLHDLSLDNGFSLSDGSCKNDAKLSKYTKNLCRYRCKDAGSPLHYCSLVDLTADFTKCQAC